MTFDPTQGRGEYGAVYLARGTLSDYSNEAMSEINRSAEGYGRYTWYKITADAKRYIDRSVVPVFQADVAGNSAFATITPTKIEYEGGWIQLSVARGATDVVRCASGKYLGPEAFLGVLSWTLSRNWKEETTKHMGDSAAITLLMHKIYEARVTHHWLQAGATLTTTGGNAHSHITLTHESGGLDGNNVSLELIDPGTTHTISVSVINKAIVVTLGYATGAITTTGIQLAGALTCPAVMSLGVTCKVKDAETGAGIVAALAHTHMSGGLGPEDYSAAADVPVVVVLYNNTVTDDRTEGRAVIPVFDVKYDSGKMIESNLTFKSFGTDWYRHVG